MDRSRRAGTKGASPQPTPVPASSRLSVRAKRNRRRPTSLWSRLPRRAAVIDACGRALRRSVPALIATAVLAVLGTGVWLGYRFVTTSQRFAIAEIEIHGTSHLSSAEVRAALPVRVGENIFTSDLGDIERALHANPWIRTASVRRMLPDTIVIELREHVAAAAVQLGVDLYLIDDGGHPFKRVELATGEAGGLPIVTGISRDAMRDTPVETAQLITSALGVLDRWRANPARPDVGEIHVDAHHAITLRTYDRGVAVQLGALRDVGDRLATFDTVWAELTDAERARLSTLHLDARSDQITVAFAD